MSIGSLCKQYPPFHAGDSLHFQFQSMPIVRVDVGVQTDDWVCPRCGSVGTELMQLRAENSPLLPSPLSAAMSASSAAAGRHGDNDHDDDDLVGGSIK